MPPVRVMHILEATEGGTARWLEDVMTGLDAARVEQSCIVSLRRKSKFGETVERLRGRGLCVWVVDMHRSIRPFSDAACLIRIVRILRRHPVDIVHAHSAKAGVLGRIAGRIAGGARIVYTPHAFAFQLDTSMRLFYTGIEKFLIPLTDRLLAVSEAEADLARRIGYRQSAIRIIRNGTEKASEDVVSGNEAPCKIGMVGALRAQKDPLTFVRACAIVHRRFPDAVFEICGAGELEGAVNAEVMKLGLAETFRCRGHATNIRERLRQWDIFALSSRFEGLPYALLEAMAMGKPVVASRVSGVEEVVVNGRDGILVPANDPGAMAGALTVLVENQSMRAEMGRAAADRVRLLYTKERQLTELETFYLSSARRK